MSNYNIRCILLIILAFKISFCGAQLSNAKLEELFNSSIIRCISEFEIDSAEKISINNIIFRPLHISSDRDTLFFSLELSSTPYMLKHLTIKGVHLFNNKKQPFILDRNKTLYIQGTDYKINNGWDFISWDTGYQNISKYIDSVYCNSYCEPRVQPIVCLCKVIIGPLLTTNRMINVFVDYYIRMAYMPMDIRPVRKYPAIENVKMDTTDTYTGYFEVLHPEFLNMISFKKNFFIVDPFN